MPLFLGYATTSGPQASWDGESEEIPTAAEGKGRRKEKEKRNKEILSALLVWPGLTQPCPAHCPDSGGSRTRDGGLTPV